MTTCVHTLNRSARAGGQSYASEVEEQQERRMMGFWDVHRLGEASEGVAEMMIRERGKKLGEEARVEIHLSFLDRPRQEERWSRRCWRTYTQRPPMPAVDCFCLSRGRPGELALARALGSGRVGLCRARPDVRTSFPAYCLALC